MSTNFNVLWRMGLVMIELPKSDLFNHDREGMRRDSEHEYVAMGFTPGTAAQLARLNAHLLRDVGLDSAGRFPE